MKKVCCVVVVWLYDTIIPAKMQWAPYLNFLLFSKNNLVR